MARTKNKFDVIPSSVHMKKGAILDRPAIRTSSTPRLADEPMRHNAERSKTSFPKSL